MTEGQIHRHEVRVYYEDTDFTGVVYHANYLKYFERAREHLIGPEELVRLYHELGIGFVVYRVADLHFHAGAVHGDLLEVRTTHVHLSDYRVAFDQSVHRANATKPLVTGRVELVCVDKSGRPVRVPSFGAVAG